MGKQALETIKKFIRSDKVDCVLVDSWQNVFYLSDFTGFSDALLLVTAEKQYIFTDNRYTEQVKVQCPDFCHIECSKHKIECIAEVIKKEKLRKLGFEEKTATAFECETLYKKLPGRLYPISDIFSVMRQTKQPEELETIKKSCEIADNALAKTIPYIKPGVTENEIAARLEYEMRVLGAMKPAFDTVVASGIRGSMPHGTATDKKIEAGDFVTIDFGAFYNGLCSDATRTVFVGREGVTEGTIGELLTEKTLEEAKICDEEAKKQGKIGNSAKICEIYKIVKEAQKAAIAGFKVGMQAAELDKIARDIITEAGYGKEFGHSLGHSVGIDVHDGFSVGPKSKTELCEGMVFSVEPGIYLPNIGGVRIEDLVCVKNGALEILTKGSF